MENNHEIYRICQNCGEETDVRNNPYCDNCGEKVKLTLKAFLNCDYAQKFFGAVYKCSVMHS